MTVPDDTEDWVWLARIRHTQGRKGEVFAEILTDFPEKFAERRRLSLLRDQSATRVASGKGTGFSPYIKPDEKLMRANSERLAAPQVPSASEGSAKPGSPVFSREVELLSHWLHKGGIVLHFAGVESITEAESLAGLIVAIPRTERASLDEDKVYVADLIGCSLIDVATAQPVTVGEIEGVDTTAGPVALLVINNAAGEVLIPFAKSYLRKIDIEAKRVEMALPAGLVELNAPSKEL